MATALGTSGITFNDSSTQNSTSIGYGQTWQDLTASRSTGVTYTNSTGRPILLCITATNFQTCTITCTINGVLMGGSSFPGQGSVGITTVVPNGLTYYIGVSSGSSATSTWCELR
jgi:hypothetical protein